MSTFIQARHYHKGRLKPILQVVMHDMEALERAGTALQVAKWFAGDSAPEASAHYCVDNTTVVQCVKEADTAWAAPNANAWGLHIELAGFASQNRAAWTDEYSRHELALAAKLVAVLCRRYEIPPIHLTPAQVRAGTKGLCGHADVTKAFETAGGHTDPGAQFPWDVFLTMLKAEIDALAGKTWTTSRIIKAAAGLGVLAVVLTGVTQIPDGAKPVPLPTAASSPVAASTKPPVHPTARPPVKPNPTPPATVHGYLRYGSRGPSVRAVQAVLGVTQDGIYGRVTMLRVEARQRAAKLPVDGIIGPRTAAALHLRWSAK